MLMLKHPFKSKWINFLAPGSLAIYLFHQNEHVWMVIKDVLLQCECIKHGGGMAILAIMAIGLCVVALLFDKVRQFFIKFLIRK